VTRQRFSIQNAPEIVANLTKIRLRMYLGLEHAGGTIIYTVSGKK